MARPPVFRFRRQVGLVEPPAVPDGRVDPGPVIDTSDISVLVRAWQLGEPPFPPAPTTVAPTRLTIARRQPDDIQDRPIEIFVDDEPWGKVRYGHTISREVAPGRHRVRAFNTLFSRVLDVDARPGEDVRLTCANGFPRAGYLMMLFLHVTYLHVRLERLPAGTDEELA